MLSPGNGAYAREGKGTARATAQDGRALAETVEEGVDGGGERDAGGGGFVGDGVVHGRGDGGPRGAEEEEQDEVEADDVERVQGGEERGDGVLGQGGAGARLGVEREDRGGEEEQAGGDAEEFACCGS